MWPSALTKGLEDWGAFAMLLHLGIPSQSIPESLMKIHIDLADILFFENMYINVTEGSMTTNIGFRIKMLSVPSVLLIAPVEDWWSLATTSELFYLCYLTIPK